jgi:Cu(I)/Ag(I) efflux system membrane fusion protein
MFVSGFLGLVPGTDDQALVIPESAVLWTGERSVVYVKTDPDSPVFELREIEVGDLVGEGYRVRSGLQKGEEIVVNGTFTIDAAAQLQGKKSMMNEGGGPGMTGHEAHSGMSTGTPADEQPGEPLAIPASLKEEFSKLLPDYLAMKDAFVLGETKTVQEGAGRMATTLSSLAGNELGPREQARVAEGLDLLNAIEATTSLEQQRSLFVRVNESLVPVFQAIGSNGQSLYVQTCPMANNNKGAIWLSADREIRNPYYGEAMLACGSVIDSLK